MTIEFFLLLLSVILLVLQTVGIGGHPRFSTGWAGLACLAASFLISSWP